MTASVIDFPFAAEAFKRRHEIADYLDRLAQVIRAGAGVTVDGRTIAAPHLVLVTLIAEDGAALAHTRANGQELREAARAGERLAWAKAGGGQ